MGRMRAELEPEDLSPSSVTLAEPNPGLPSSAPAAPGAHVPGAGQLQPGAQMQPNICFYE